MKTEFKAISKRIVKVYAKNGNESFKCRIESEDGYVKDIAPRSWMHLDLPDTTSDATKKDVVLKAIAQLSRESLRDAITFNDELKAAGVDRDDFSNPAMIALVKKYVHSGGIQCIN